MERQTMIRHQMYRRIEAMHIEIALLRVDLALRAFNPNQPRVPAGRSDGGQWTSGDDTGVPADEGDARIYRISDGDGLSYNVGLGADEGRGGHTVGRHVGKSDDELFNRIDKMRTRFFGIEFGERRDGTFSDLATANSLVNETLRENSLIVAEVASGKRPAAWVKKNFGFKTGREAYINSQGAMFLRNTVSVGVRILHDPTSSRGFRVRTAYPLTDGD